MVAGSSARPLAAGPASGDDQPVPPSTRTLAGHCLLLFLLLGSLMLLIGRGVYTIDEAAYRFQAEVAESGDWGLPYPTDDLFDQTIAAPMTNSELADEAWYPAARRPAYVQLVASSANTFGYYGPILLSIFGVIMAAVGIERISRWLGGIPTWTGFWLTGIGGPVAFHGLVAWAHAPALGQMAIGTAALLTAERDNRRAALGGALAVAFSILQRSESPIMVVGIIAALVIAARDEPHYRQRAVLAASTSAFALGVARMWHAAVVDPTAVSGAGSGRGLDLGRYAHSTFEILISPGIDGIGTLRVLSVLLFVVAIGWLRRHPDDGVPIASVLAAAAVLAAVVGSLQVASYGALLPAFPLLALGIPAIGFGGSRRSAMSTLGHRSARRHLALAVAAAIGIGGPIVASVSGGGGLGWGGRYVLASMVAVVPLTASGCARLWKRPETRPIVLAACVATAAVQVSGVRTLDAYHRLSITASEAITAELPTLSEEMDLIIAIDARIGRLAAEQASESPLVSASDDEITDTLLDLAANAELDRVAIVSYEHPVEIEPPTPWRQVEYRDQPVQVLVLSR